MSFLEVKNLCKSFDETESIRNLNLSVSKGEKVVIMGSHKSGKTSLLRILSGLDAPDSGEILLEGMPLSFHGKNGKIGMFSQDFHLFSNLNVLDNLCLAPVKLYGVRRKNAEGKAHEWLSKAGLTEKAKYMPHNLSEGQRQRAAICRSLMTDPEIMLFDDTKNAIDPNVTDEVTAMMKMIAKHDLTMLIVSNNINFANDVADRVIFISDGEIYEEGKPDEILRNPKREKTIAFIRKLKSFTFTFDTCDFDLIQLQGNIQKFAEKYGLSKHSAYRLQICVEELVYEMLFGSCMYAESVNLLLEVSYSDSDSSVIIELYGKGTKFNPFEDESKGELNKSVHLGVSMLRKIAREISYDFSDNKNHLRVVM